MQARYARRMAARRMAHGRVSRDVLLLLDTCGERASVAVVNTDGTMLAERLLGPREASTGLLEAIRAALLQAGLPLHELACVGVVNGPGSFTGVRIGLAMGKGLCEAGQLPMAAVSRLEVLAEAGPPRAISAISAGREQVYARIVQENRYLERLLSDQDLMELCQGAPVVVDSRELVARLGRLAGGEPVQQVELTAAHAFRPVLRRLAAGGSDPGSTDANYVRDEGAIYRKTLTITARVESR